MIWPGCHLHLFQSHSGLYPSGGFPSNRVRCHSVLDARGRHRAACTLSGRVKKRATPIERVLARVCREAGARVRFDAYLRDMNVDVAASDGRRIEVLARPSLLWRYTACIGHYTPLCLDTCGNRTTTGQMWTTLCWSMPGETRTSAHPRHENQKIMSPGVFVQVGNTRQRHVLRDSSVMSRSSHWWRLLGEPLCGLRADLGQDSLSRVAPPVLPRRSALSS